MKKNRDFDGFLFSIFSLAHQLLVVGLAVLSLKKISLGHLVFVFCGDDESVASWTGNG
jgi:hypothetical protein